MVNAGNANVFTGRAGAEATRASAAAAANLVGCPPKQVFLGSTGVIGEVLPYQRLVAALPALHEALDEDGWEAAARGIMTTDTFPKGATRTAQIGDTTVRISGIAKGSGMIAPDMATMLCFIFTDAKIPAHALQRVLGRGVTTSFNCTTVDSDTSTSDTVLLFATGQTKASAHSRRRRQGFERFRARVERGVAGSRAAGGARRRGRAETHPHRRQRRRHRREEIRASGVGMVIANSPLVKTAIAGEDANWGRIVMAVGKAGEPADRDKLSVGVGGVWMARDGAVIPGYDEAPVVAHMKGREVAIAVDLGMGRGRATVWTCDLTHGYIDINGSYRS